VYAVYSASCRVKRVRVPSKCYTESRDGWLLLSGLGSAECSH